MRIANGFISDALIQTENSTRTVASHAEIIMQKNKLGGLSRGSRRGNDCYWSESMDAGGESERDWPGGDGRWRRGRVGVSSV
jgi:hypothetical protein